MKIHLKPEELKMILNILKQHVPESTVIAFGSRVHGRNLKEFSDLDLTVKSPDPLATEKLLSLQNAFSQSDLPFKVDVIDWADTDTNFRKIIEADWTLLQSASSKS